MKLSTSPQSVITGNETLPSGDHRREDGILVGAALSWTIIAICSAVFLFQLMLGINDGRTPLTPATRIFDGLFALYRDGLRAGYLWQLVTHIFMHGNVLHIVLNMLCLASVGPLVERQLGHWHFLAIFILGGIAGGLFQVASSPDMLVGASGGVFALVLALVSFQPQARMWLLVFFVIPIRMRARTLEWGLILGTLFFIGLGLIPGLRQFSMPEIGHMAHLGGMLFGLAYVRLFIGTADEDIDEPFDPPIYPGEPRPARRLRNESSPRRPVPLPLPPPTPFALTRPARPLVRSQRQVDPLYEALLDKLEREGLHSLTPAELRQIERGGRH